jgi:hypothetical protein
VALETELAAYRRELPTFLREHEGEFVLIKGEEIAGFWHTENQAFTSGRLRFGVTPFLVRKIQKEQAPLAIVAHPVYRCPS